MYTFREIRDAIAGAEANRKAGEFPYGTDWRKAIETAKSSPEFAELIGEIRAEAERAVREPIEPLPFSKFHLFEKEGTRLEYERPYFDRRGRLLGLTFAFLIDVEERYITALEDLIWEICAEYTWSLPAHVPVGLEAALKAPRSVPHTVDLFAAETAHGLAEVLYLLGDRLNPWIAYRIRNELEERIMNPLFGNPLPFLWESQTHNWSAVCGGAVGMAALLTVEDPERLAGMTDRILRSMECYLEGFGEDGGCAEGIGYWTYGFGYYTYFADMLESYTGGKLRLLDGEKLRRIASFPLSVTLSPNRFVNFSDASDRATLHTGMVSRLAERCGVEVPYMDAVPSLHQDHCYRFPHTSRNLLWTKPELLRRPVPEGSAELPDLQWVAGRLRVEQGLLGFSAKGGHNEEPHNHNDLGHFILHAEGESLLMDLGAGVYTREYFGANRYTFLHNSSRGHSVPLIEGTEQQPGAHHKAVVIEKQVQPDRIRLSLDLTQAYQVEHLEAFERSFDWSRDPGGRGACLELTDSFRFTRKPEHLEEVFLSSVEPELLNGAVRFGGRKGEVLLKYDGDRMLASYESISTQEHQGAPVTVYRVSLKPMEQKAESSFLFRFELSLV